MNLALQRQLAALAALPVAVLVGWHLAQGTLLWPVLLTGAAAAFAVVRYTRVSLDVAVGGGLLFGYLVGNRGFAQQMPLPGLPLFPAEFGLGLGLTWMLVQCARHKELPWQRDALNWTVLLWIALGSARFAFDLRSQGILALRDYATVYYALFFFVAQRQARDDDSRRFFCACLLAGSLVLLPVFALFQFFPDFFLGSLSVRGVPLVFYKNDLVQTFLALGSVLLFHFAARQWWRWLGYLGSLLLGGFVLAGNSRAAILGLFTATVWLLAGRRTAYAKFMIGGGASVAVVLLLATWMGGRDWRGSDLFVVYERAVSVFDPYGVRVYDSVALADKPDNNRFRLVWWRSVIAETWERSPVFGLGFGYDLAENFLRVYEYDLGEDFNVRSPHSIVVTIFGRMGAIGLGVWTLIVGAMARYTWRALRAPADGGGYAAPLWCACWVILVSACFGVVLEGPMGAVVFWTMLGLASATTAAEREQRDEENAASATAEPVAAGAPPAPA